MRSCPSKKLWKGSSVTVSTYANVNRQVKHNNMSKVSETANIDSERSKVMSREGSGLEVRQCRRVFCNKQCAPSEVESLSVRPPGQSIKIFKAVGLEPRARSYADVVKGTSHTINKLSNYNKSRVFWARYNNIGPGNNDQVGLSLDTGSEVIRNDNERDHNREVVFGEFMRNVNMQNNGLNRTIKETLQKVANHEN